MAALSFPPLKPEFLRELTPSDFGVVVSEFRGAFEKRTSPNATGAGTQMVFEYRNRTAADVNLLVSFYRACLGSYRSFTIDTNLLRHPDAYRLALCQLIDTSLWRFNEAFVVRTLYRGTYEIDIKLTSVANNAPVSLLTGDTFPCNLSL